MTVETKFYRDTWAEINLDHVSYNVRETIKLLPEGKKLFAVVKANAYGHGDVQIARTAIEAGAQGLAVAFFDEALSVKKADLSVPLLVLGASNPEAAQIAAEQQISLTVFRLEWLKEAEKYLEDGQVLRVHIKCDTGMGRLGVKTVEELNELAAFIDESPKFFLEGVFTHFATADALDTDYFEEQYQTFTKMIDELKVKPAFVHCANSATTLRFKKAYFNAVRLGISMYGLAPSNEMKEELPFPLKQAFSLHTRIVHIKKLKKGEKISYGATYETQGEEWIATLPIGYADGWLRKLQGQEVLVNGKKVPIVGRVCMDQCMIRLPEEMSVGTQVTLIGKQGEEEITMDDIARKMDTINYEVPCIITARVPRVYKQNGETIEVINSLLK
ncbi:alanine racemase [Pseudobacillus wudalianchiensis]|uniref:Alanine racemase n=1 Tax=Pseudobacillus wudalianchiensis TaxID=1743143 RepID=A0A1B9AAS2_9BACI|nr:alanine racemase [Bacillus wudalianchiensis]OCA80953.1 alanine racemase [Bacillus wudalianchiensis]